MIRSLFWGSGNHMETFVLVDSCTPCHSPVDCLALCEVLLRSLYRCIAVYFDVFCYRAQVPDTKKPREEIPF